MVVPDARAGEYAVVYAARAKAAARQAERKRADFDTWYERVRVELGAENADDR